MKIFKIIGITFLVCFSFYYTDYLITFSKTKTNLYKTIEQNKNKFNSNKVEAVIKNDEMLSGNDGLIIDIEESFNKMDNYGEYNENLFIFVKDYPKNKVINSKDKYIIGKNTIDYEIAIGIILKDMTNIEKIISILNMNSVNVDFFVEDSVVKENNIVQNTNNYISSYGNNGNYNTIDLKYIKKVLKIYNNNETSYCLTNTKSEKKLNICKNEGLNTILSEIISVSPYKNIKNNLDKGKIYIFENNNYLIKELDIVLKYVKSKGYKIKLLKDFLN